MVQKPSCAASSLARCQLPRLPYLACSRRTLKRQPPPPGCRCKLSHQRVVCRPRRNLKIPGPPAAMAGAPRRHVRLLDRVSAARRCLIQQPTSVNPGWAGGNQKICIRSTKAASRFPRDPTCACQITKASIFNICSALKFVLYFHAQIPAYFDSDISFFSAFPRA